MADHTVEMIVYSKTEILLYIQKLQILLIVPFGLHNYQQM